MRGSFVWLGSWPILIYFFDLNQHDDSLAPAPASSFLRCYYIWEYLSLSLHKTILNQTRSRLLRKAIFSPQHIFFPWPSSVLWSVNFLCKSHISKVQHRKAPQIKWIYIYMAMHIFDVRGRQILPSRCSLFFFGMCKISSTLFFLRHYQ